MRRTSKIFDQFRKVVILGLLFGFLASNSAKASPEILILGIHSYSSSFPWTNKLIKSFEATLEGKNLKNFAKPSGKLNFKIRNFHLEVKKRPISKFGKPLDEINIIKKWAAENKPSAVYITDDFALNEFAPWLKDLKIPIVFAGINGVVPGILDNDRTKISGVYERYYLQESINLLREILGKEQLNIAILLEDSPTGKIISKLVAEVLVKQKKLSHQVFVSNNYKEWMRLIKIKKFDAFFPLQPYAIRKGGKNYPAPQLIEDIVKYSVRPTVFTASWHIKCGGSLAVTLWPSAQGYHAAELLKKLFNDKKSKKVIPIYGEIELNNISIARYNLKVPYELLASARIHQTIQTPCAP